MSNTNDIKISVILSKGRSTIINLQTCLRPTHELNVLGSVHNFSTCYKVRLDLT